MAHTYASVNTFKDYLRDQGSASAGGLGTANDALYLEWLEDASRSIDDYCRRTRESFPMSGFGPRLGTNRYDHDGSDEVELGDDLLSLTSVTSAPSVGATPVTLTDETDFYKEPYDNPPYRCLALHSAATAVFYACRRGVSVTGTWGYSNETVASTTTVASGLAVSSSATTFTTSASPTISAGDTLLIDSEQLYVTALSGTTATVTRGANGTTAATHANSSAIATYRYPRPVHATTLRLAHRRWRQRDAGLTGTYGEGGGIPGTSNYDTEVSILRNGVWEYRLVRV